LIGKPKARRQEDIITTFIQKGILTIMIVLFLLSLHQTVDSIKSFHSRENIHKNYIYEEHNCWGYWSIPGHRVKRDSRGENSKY
jgi:hypothetical protein